MSVDSACNLVNCCNISSSPSSSSSSNNYDKQVQMAVMVSNESSSPLPSKSILRYSRMSSDGSSEQQHLNAKPNSVTLNSTNALYSLNVLQQQHFEKQQQSQQQHTYDQSEQQHAFDQQQSQSSSSSSPSLHHSEKQPPQQQHNTLTPSSRNNTLPAQCPASSLHYQIPSTNSPILASSSTQPASSSGMNMNVTLQQQQHRTLPQQQQQQQQHSVGSLPPTPTSAEAIGSTPSNTASSEVELARRLGVRFDSSNAAWVARWIEPHTEKKKSRWFSVAKYGELAARRLAIQACLQNTKPADFAGLRDLQDVLSLFATAHPSTLLASNNSGNPSLGMYPSSHHHPLSNFDLATPDSILAAHHSSGCFSTSKLPNGPPPPSYIHPLYSGQHPHNTFTPSPLTNYMAAAAAANLSTPSPTHTFISPQHSLAAAAATSSSLPPPPQHLFPTPISLDYFVYQGVPQHHSAIGYVACMNSTTTTQSGFMKQTPTSSSSLDLPSSPLQQQQQQTGENAQMKKEEGYVESNIKEELDSASGTGTNVPVAYENDQVSQMTEHNLTKLQQQEQQQYCLTSDSMEMVNHHHQSNYLNSLQQQQQQHIINDPHPYHILNDTSAAAAANLEEHTLSEKHSHNLYNLQQQQLGYNKASHLHLKQQETEPSLLPVKSNDLSTYENVEENAYNTGSDVGQHDVSESIVTSLYEGPKQQPTTFVSYEETESFTASPSSLHQRNLQKSEDLHHIVYGGPQEYISSTTSSSSSELLNHHHHNEKKSTSYSDDETNFYMYNKKRKLDNNDLCVEDEIEQQQHCMGSQESTQNYDKAAQGNETYTRTTTSSCEPIENNSTSLYPYYNQQNLPPEDSLPPPFFSPQHHNHQFYPQLYPATAPHLSHETNTNTTSSPFLPSAVNGGGHLPPFLPPYQFTMLPSHLHTPTGFLSHLQPFPLDLGPNANLYNALAAPYQTSQHLGLTNGDSPQSQTTNGSPTSVTPPGMDDGNSYTHHQQHLNGPGYKRLQTPNGLPQTLNAKMTCERGLHYSKCYRGNQECWIAVWNTKGGRIMHEAFDVTIMGFEQAKSKAREARDSAHSNNLVVAENSRPSWKSHSNTGIPHVSLDSQQLRFRAHKFGRRLCRSFSFGRRRGSFASRESAFDAAVLWLIQSPTEEEIATVSGNVSSKIEEPM